MKLPSRIDRRARAITGVVVIVLLTIGARAHDVTTKVTWNREISRIVYARCASCHRHGGAAFSLMDYAQASPWAAAIKETVLRRQMPPWGAVKGFGDFRNDRALSQEQIDLIVNWVDGGVPEGNPDHLPTRPQIATAAAVAPRDGEIAAGHAYRMQRAFVLDGFRVAGVTKNISAPITIDFPGGRIVPLVWLDGDAAGRDHPFLLRSPIDVPAGAVVRGLPAGVSLTLFAAATAPVTPRPARAPRESQTPRARR